jgi:hypothetical protein
MAQRLMVWPFALMAALLLRPATGRCQDRSDYRTEADSLARYRATFRTIAQDSQVTGPDRQAAQALLAATELCYESVYALSQIKKLDACLSQESRSTMGAICYDYEYRTLDLLTGRKDSIDAFVQRATDPKIIAAGNQLSGYLSQLTGQIARWIKRRTF